MPKSLFGLLFYCKISYTYDEFSFGVFIDIDVFVLCLTFVGITEQHKETAIKFIVGYGFQLK